MPYFFLILLLSFFLSACNPSNEGPGTYSSEQKSTIAKVIGVSDGDTFKWLTAENQTIRVRLHGVDAPEKGQDFGVQSRNALSDLITDKEIRLEEKTKDRYGRMVAIVYANNINVNEDLLKNGWVWHYKTYDKNKHWAALEAEARIQKRGLWSQPNAIAPWQWRKNQKEAKKKKKESMQED